MGSSALDIAALCCPGARGGERMSESQAHGRDTVWILIYRMMGSHRDRMTGFDLERFLRLLCRKHRDRGVEQRRTEVMDVFSS